MKLKHNMQLLHKTSQSEEYLELHKNSEPYVQQLMEQSYYKLSHLEPPLPGSGVFGDEEVEPQQPAASSSSSMQKAVLDEEQAPKLKPLYEEMKKDFDLSYQVQYKNRK